MSSFDYGTPREVYEMIKPLVNKYKAKQIYDPFYLKNGNCKQYMEDVFKTKIIYEDRNAWSFKPECDLIVTNPPFENKVGVIKYLLTFNKPWFCILPTAAINNKSLHSFFKENNISLIIPSGRIEYEKIVPDNKLASFGTLICHYDPKQKQSKIIWV